MFDFLANLFNTSGFPPRWHCGLWTAGHGWLHILSDIGIWSAYYAIPLVLAYVAYRRRDVPFRTLFWLFGAFILACGTIHLMDAIIFWWPAYRFLGLIKFITAVVSWATVIAIVPMIPEALHLRTPKDLEREVGQRTAELAESNEALRKGEQRLQLALEAGRMGTWEWSLQTNRVIWSPNLEAIHGIAPGSFPGTFEAFENFIHPEDRQRVLRSVAEAVDQGSEHRAEYRLVWPDGSVHWVESRGRVFYDGHGKPVRMIGVRMDISERKRSEQSLRLLADASRSLATLVDYQSTMQKVAGLAVPNFADWCLVHIADEDGTLQPLAAAHTNPAKAELLDQLPKDLTFGPKFQGGATAVYRTGQSAMMAEISDSDLESVAPDRKHLDVLRQLDPRSQICVPLTLRNHVLGVMTFAFSESGRRYTPADLAIAEDLAHRSATAIENARLYAQVRDADRRKDDFLAMLAHELRNPLAPIRSGLDLLAMSGCEQDTVELMQEQLNHIVRLVDDLLDVSRIMRGKIPLHKERVPLQLVLQRSLDSVRPLAEARGQELSVSLPTATIWLEADPVRLAQIATNLLNNAVKYTPKAGRIWLTAKQEGDHAVLSVRDNGIGIDPEMLPHVFDLFVQADRSLDRTQGGLGIGLTLVRNLVEMHGGTVEARSEGPGKGSEFLVRFQVSAQAHREPGPISPKAPAAPRRILIVEDNVGAAKVLARLLAKTGEHAIEVVHDGVAGLEKVKSFHPDLVLLDIGLPGMDGYEVARQLRQEPNGDALLIVALTGYGQEEDRRRSKEAGFDEHLLKPPSLDVLQTLFGHPKLARRDSRGPVIP